MAQIARHWITSFQLLIDALLWHGILGVATCIDGEWCREGRHFVIEGPNIITYGGSRMTGDYNRHGFRYTVPASEPEAGVEIVMALQSETTLTLFRQPKGGATNPPQTGEIWNRCRVTS